MHVFKGETKNFSQKILETKRPLGRDFCWNVVVSYMRWTFFLKKYIMVFLFVEKCYCILSNHWCCGSDAWHIHCVQQAGAGMVWCERKILLGWLELELVAGVVWEEITIALEATRPAERWKLLLRWYVSFLIDCCAFPENNISPYKPLLIHVSWIVESTSQTTTRPAKDKGLLAWILFIQNHRCASRTTAQQLFW